MVQVTVSYANGTGSFAASSMGCGSARLHATGAPNLCGIVDYTVGGHTGALQALLLGFCPSNLPACPGCVVGTSIDAMLLPRLQLSIPCDPGLVGSVWRLQGVDAVGATGGCELGGIDYRLTDTIRTQVGG